jgi:HKD family nuclease
LTTFLVGRADKKVLEEVALGLQQAEALKARLEFDQTMRRSELQQAAEQVVNDIGRGVSQMPQTQGSEQAITKLRDLVTAGKIEVHAYLKGSLHAKAYLCWYPKGSVDPGSAIVGSSNFTLAGFTGNTELNVRVTGDSEMQALKDWFNALWDDSADITKDFLAELNRSWPLAETPPYHVYLKALYELYGDEVTGALPAPPPPREPKLANFQLDAVGRALRMIDLHGGCYIGDVVGLGKTYIGAEILRQLRYTEKGDPLIICPAGLVTMWERINELFQLGAAIVSMSIIVPKPSAKWDEETEEYLEEPVEGLGVVLQDKYGNRGPVLVDEAHNFRNINRRNRALTEYLETGDHKVVLLSATPQNLGPRDIYRQLRLFLDEIDHGLNLEPLALEEYFAAVQAWHQYKLEFESWQLEYEQWQVKAKKVAEPPARPVEPKYQKAEIERVLTPVFIRRRRRDIKELYGDKAEVNGKPVHFPTPKLENIPYLLNRVYAKTGPLENLLTKLKQHKASRYRVTDYIKPSARTKAQYRDLYRARNRIAALMSALLGKRLESSIEAFRATLESLMSSNRNFKTVIEAGYIPIGKTATRLLAGGSFDPDEALEILQAEEERRTDASEPRSKLVHSIDDFNVDEWIEDLDKDYKVLSGILKSMEDIGPDDDDKLRSLKEFLAGLGQDEKIVIFSEAETTVNYLYNQLNPGGKDKSISRLSGDNREQTGYILKRFSPDANLKKDRTGKIVERMPGPEVRILIATDVVSEGQNLQDCGRVLNYDLHWNPVRMIQRFGRVDRIGTQYSEIHLNNMWPDTDIDNTLSLTDRLLNRIQSFHDLIGLDNKLLHTTEKLNTNAMYRIYVKHEIPESDDDSMDDIAAHQVGVALLQQLQQEDPKLWETITNLPDGIRAAKPIKRKEPEIRDTEAQRFTQQVLEIEGAQMPMMTPVQEQGIESPFDDPRVNESVVLLSVAGITWSYAVDDRLSPRVITPSQLISALQCEPNTPGHKLPEKHNERVMACYFQFRKDAERRLGRSRRPGSQSRIRRYLSKYLNLAREEAKDNPEELQRIALLRQIFLDTLPETVLPELRDIRDIGLEGTGLIRRLEALRQRYRLNPPTEDETSETTMEAEVVRIVCSEGLV